MRNKMSNNKNLACRNCGTNLKLQSPPDGIITFSCEECGGKVSWKISNLSNRIEMSYLPEESKGIEFTRIEKSIAKITIVIIILLSIVLLFYMLAKN